MNPTLREDADQIVRQSIQSVLPDEAVRKALKEFQPGTGKTLLVATGKAAWQMAKAAVDVLAKVDGGIVITKYDHVMGEIPGVECCEAGHPVPDENGFAATGRALELVQDLGAEDEVEANCYMHWYILALAIVAAVGTFLLRKKKAAKKIFDAVAVLLLALLAIIGSCIWDWILFVIGAIAIAAVIYKTDDRA